MSSPPLADSPLRTPPPPQPFVAPIHDHTQIADNSPLLDEGYSGDRSDSDMAYAAMQPSVASTPDMDAVLRSAMMLSTEKRKELAMSLVHTMPNDCKEDVRLLIERLTHFDPAAYLPTEIFLHVFDYLSPTDLLATSMVSRRWRDRSFDERLWQLCFAREGWELDKGAVERFVEQARDYGQRKMDARLDRQQRRDRATAVLERRESRKRRRVEAFSGDLTSDSDSAGGLDLGIQEDRAEGKTPSDVEEMDGLEQTSTAGVDPTASKLPVESTMILSEVLNRRFDPYNSYDLNKYRNITFPPSPADIKLRPSVFQTTSDPTLLKLSWPFIYKQRRRLEANWDKNRHKTFQLPHPDHPEEGHTECVYTVQHTSRYLVSGSRDKTIRIWNLHTNRLRQKPLIGHEKSVLCLQYDERPEQDIIVSGGSDSAVIVWKFSTGEVVKHVSEAHTEPVLNLRFDDRYIVTCSKDKTIKLWSRHALARDSELIPIAALANFADPKAGLLDSLTHLSTIRGHGAAVNAVQIHDNTIVSASGDRTVIAWNIMTGKQTRMFKGHAKGIACVQFDGRRIVSGSSDMTVRIFDAGTAAEVACLSGHANLVRTVQARFGDLRTTSDTDLAAEAQTADRNWQRAVAAGMEPATSRRAASRSAGSSRPEDMLSLGAKVPPGGGGSRWAKIVSGSYDETVIVWRRDERDAGNWVQKVVLNQNDLLREQQRRQNRRADDAQPQNPVFAHPGGAPVQPAGPAAAGLPHASAMPAITQQAAAAYAQQQQQQQAPPPPPPQQPPQQLGGHAQFNPAAAANNGRPADSHRIFKLQFDPRRIICCSQNNTIVGWDFACGERELEWVGEWCGETA
ncbi:uncharacterized protein LTR77_001291 [Saxophila tyrrhenica]|uniref:F-box domain-containing protein n=1 Tax=Saxophila tyrrhenica TaxID=1690608 RepID=A0AAV9PKD8_9PEZI|nr:hypothetical protein LTR77_001291 [Saxophila tyrrhenica]